MDWMNALQDIFQRYSGQPGGAAVAPADAHNDFSEVARKAPQDVVAGGISQMFRSDQTPSFAEMVTNLFGQSNPNQRAGLLNQLLGAIGGTGALRTMPGLSGLSGLFRGGTVTPEQANEVSPDEVQQIAAHAERQDSSVIDKVSSFYSQHPDVMKAVGGLALSVALQHMLRRR